MNLLCISNAICMLKVCSCSHFRCFFVNAIVHTIVVCCLTRQGFLSQTRLHVLISRLAIFSGVQWLFVNHSETTTKSVALRFQGKYKYKFNDNSLRKRKELRTWEISD